MNPESTIYRPSITDSGVRRFNSTMIRLPGKIIRVALWIARRASIAFAIYLLYKIAN